MPSIQKTLRILDFIRAYSQTNDFAPTLRDIGNRFGLRSVSSVHRHLDEMRRRGWIKRARYERTIEVIKPEEKKAA